MKTRIAAVVTALVLGVAPISSAMAFGTEFPFVSSSPRDVETTGSIGGNANQQNFPVKQYGQTTGGHRC